MPGSQAVIGRLDANVPMGAPNPGKWYLVYRSAPTIMELMPSQTLIDATIVKNTVSQTTTLTFTKLLIEQGEITINARGNNIFLWARGSGDTSFSQHDERGTVSLEFCLVDGDCVGGSKCNPRVCTSSFTCQDGPSPCAADQTCVLNTACVPCSSCNNNQASCESTAPNCSYQSNTPACASYGICNDCNQSTCINLVGCTWGNNSCTGSPNTLGGTCSGTNPGYRCEAAPTTSAPNSTPTSLPTASPTPPPTPMPTPMPIVAST